MVQAAGSLVNMATKGKLKSKQLTKWILKKQKEKMPWGKLVCAVAAKLLRIVRAVLISNKPYNSKIAGVSCPRKSSYVPVCQLSKGIYLFKQKFHFLIRLLKAIRRITDQDSFKGTGLK